ncbi:MAG: hypothetical protein ACRCZS_02195 [Chroococcidiopsis sp.]
MTGCKIGMIEVLTEAPSTQNASGFWVSQYHCKCDCGIEFVRSREVLQQSRKRNCSLASCGCAKKEYAKTTKHPLLEAGTRFGLLTVLDAPLVRTPTTDNPDKYVSKYRFLCDCGNEVIARRADVTSGKQKSCGCFKKTKDYKGGLPPEDLTGQRFGQLTAKRLLSKEERRDRKEVEWLCECDCGQLVNKQVQRLKSSSNAKRSYLHCGDRERHPEGVGSWYPPMPTPIPEGVGELYLKFEKYTNTRLRKNRDKILDFKRGRLLRGCWILYYREVYLGETLSEEYKSNFLRKSTVYSSVDVFWIDKIESYGGQITDCQGRVRKLKLNRRNSIGSDMANLTFPTYPVLEESGNNLLPKRPRKFKRC